MGQGLPTALIVAQSAARPVDEVAGVEPEATVRGAACADELAAEPWKRADGLSSLSSAWPLPLEMEHASGDAG